MLGHAQNLREGGGGGVDGLCREGGREGGRVVPDLGNHRMRVAGRLGGGVDGVRAALLGDAERGLGLEVEVLLSAWMMEYGGQE